MGRKSRGKGSFRRVRDFIAHKQKAGALLIVVTLAPITWASSQLLPEFKTLVTGWFGISDRTLFLAVLGTGIVALTLYIAINWRDIFQSNQGLDGLIERSHIVRIDTEGQLRQIQEGLVPEIFGVYSAPDEEVYRIFRKNPRRSIALYSDELNRFVGFASIWPITPEAAAAIKEGRRVEEDLTEADILPLSENQTAKFAVIPAIAVLPDERRENDGRGFKLMRAFVKFIIEEYLASPGRSIQLIASGYSRQGISLCTRYGMHPLGDFQHSGGQNPAAQDNRAAAFLKRLIFWRKGKQMPLFYKDMTKADLKRLRNEHLE